MKSLVKLELIIRKFSLHFVKRIGDEIFDFIKETREEFEDYKARSIVWSVADFEDRSSIEKFNNYKFDKTKFSLALKLMIKDHDANTGITWDTVDYYLDTYCRKD